MSSITVRFVHRQSRAPVLELEGVEASATVGALRELLVERLASEEVCMMRVFVNWHAQIVLPGGKKRLIELTDEDAEASLSSMGISHLGEVHLDGPLTGNSDGVGQALAVLGAQMHREQSRTNALLETLVAQNACQVQSNNIQRAVNQLTLLPSEAYLARQALAAEEELAYGQLMLVGKAEEGYQRLNEGATGPRPTETCKKLSMEAQDLPIPFAIDRTTPHETFSISDDGTTATKTSQGYATLRTHPLTTTNHKFAVKIVEDVGALGGIIIGLLPKLSDAQVAEMEGGTRCIGYALGGWGMWKNGLIEGDWECPAFTFAKGDIIVFDYNFAAKTLTLSCGNRKAAGTIPSIKEGDALYPAVSMYYGGAQVAFVA